MTASSHQGHARGRFWWIGETRTLVAAPLGLAALIGLEAAWLPAKLLRQAPENSFHVVAYLFSLSYRYLWSPLLYLLLLSLLSIAPIHRRVGPRARATLHLLLAAAVSAHAYLVMTRYEGFAGDVMIAAAFAAACAFLAGASLITRTHHRGWRKLVAPALLTGAGIAAVSLNHTILRGTYATFHLAAAELNLAVFGLAALHVAARDLLPLPRQPWARILIASVGVLALVGLPFATFESGKTARKYVRKKTNIGIARTVYDPEALARHLRSSRVKPLDEDEAVAVFERFSGLPPLPAEFALADYDIVLITIDALRWDQTSLADSSLDTTPNLVEFAQEGNFEFTRAYSPSSTTLQSMASVLAMSPAPAAHLDIWKMTWAGRLRLAAVTVPELLRALGYATHWIGHDHQDVFSEKIIGVEQGFDSRSLVPETGKGWTSRGVDAQIAKLSVAKLDEVPTDQRLFAWFFLVSPHAPYVIHNQKAPKTSNLERYRQEVRNADRQVGRILDKLKRQDRMDQTIVIITSDHGEEFGERGGERHAKTVYEEVTHVPLLIHVPGMEGTRVETPTSLVYLFPWLLLHAEGPPREQVVRVLGKRLGPLMKGTEGAIATELLGRNHETTGLISGDLKLIYDHQNEIVEVYDLAADPGETDDLSFSDPARAAALDPLLQRYLDVREYSRNFRLRPRKRVWRSQDEEWLDERVDELGEVVPETDEIEVKAPKSVKAAKPKAPMPTPKPTGPVRAKKLGPGPANPAAPGPTAPSPTAPGPTAPGPTAPTPQ